MQELLLHKSWKRLFIFLVCCLGLFGLSRVYFRLTDDFRIANMTYEMPHRLEWEVEDLSKTDEQKLDEILKQKFTYIGKGAQSYAFGSEDQRYVLKFFKFKHLKPHWLVELLPPFPPFSTYKEKQTQRKWNKLESVFAGYRLAYEVHRPESGLIYIHLNKTHQLYPMIYVKDKLGLNREVDLDDVVFVVQDMAMTTRMVMQKLLAEGDVQTAQKRIKQIFDLYLSEYHKGIYDRDHGVMHNTGFVGNKPIHLDVGKLTADERIRQPDVYKPDLAKIALKFTIWIQANYPQYYPEMDGYIEKLMTEVLG